MKTIDRAHLGIRVRVNKMVVNCFFILGVGVNGPIFRNKGNFNHLCKIIFLDIIRRNFLISGIFDGLPDKKLDPVNLAKID